MKQNTKKIAISLLSICCLIIGVFLGGVVIPWLSYKTSNWGNSEVMATITVLGVIVALLVPIIEFQLTKFTNKKSMQAVYQIEILVDTLLPDNMVCFSASIQNVGDKELKTKTSSLYIDQGVETNLTNDRDSSDMGVKSYKFPFILEHREDIDGRPDCVLCKKCFRENDYTYPEEIVDASIKGIGNLLRTHIVLEHISHKSIQYIKPKEKFAEDVIVQFRDAGVYRVTLFVGIEGEADCMCATKQFYIPKSLSKNG